MFVLQVHKDKLFAEILYIFLYSFIYMLLMLLSLNFPLPKAHYLTVGLDASKEMIERNWTWNVLRYFQWRKLSLSSWDTTLRYFIKSKQALLEKVKPPFILRWTVSHCHLNLSFIYLAFKKFSFPQSCTEPGLDLSNDFPWVWNAREVLLQGKLADRCYCAVTLVTIIETVQVKEYKFGDVTFIKSNILKAKFRFKLTETYKNWGLG